MKTKGALLWEPGTRSGWSIEEIELDPPKEREALIRLAVSGLCHSDDHLETGDMQIPFAPLLGGHEGAGVVEQVGPGVAEVSPAIMSRCIHPCVRHLHSLRVGSAEPLRRGSGSAGGQGTRRYAPDHARGKGVGAMSFLGTFSPYGVAPIDAVIKIDPAIPLDVAALVGCGFRRRARGLRRRYPDRVPVVVAGVGGVGMNAVQGPGMPRCADRRGRPGRVEAEEGEEFGAMMAASLEEAAARVGEIRTAGLRTVASSRSASATAPCCRACRRSFAKAA